LGILCAKKDTLFEFYRHLGSKFLSQNPLEIAFFPPDEARNRPAAQISPGSEQIYTRVLTLVSKE
jgi:hypothetical protein